MSDREPNPADPFLVMQQQMISSLVVQIISAGRRPGGHIKDCLGVLEELAATVLVKSVEESADGATLAAFMDVVRQRIASLRHPAG